MRKGNRNGFIIEDDIFIGINLGWDFTAEHEWGIAGLKGYFGLEGVHNGLINKRIGIDARRVTKLPEYFKLFVKGEFTYLVSARHMSGDDMSKKALDSMVQAYWTSYGENDNEITLNTAWDENSFGIAVRGKEERKHLKLLFEAFNNNDAIITFGHDGNPFSNSGLMLLIASKLPKEYVDSQAAADLNKIKLNKASDKTGIIKRLKKADRQYFACSPRWANDEKTEVHYWLNPMKQDRYDSGWMTVADLDDWISDSGKVMKESVES